MIQNPPKCPWSLFVEEMTRVGRHCFLFLFLARIGNCSLNSVSRMGLPHRKSSPWVSEQQNLKPNLEQQQIGFIGCVGGCDSS